ncbi:MAG: glycosyltransferase family 39 protein [Chloroflexi bacterium]|nr:glycosyltransferase family 39 protein [Chloroflexota bacterium]
MTGIWTRVARICRSSPMAAYTIVLLAGLVVRSITASFVSQPGYMDSYYYFHVAENLYQGRGFVEDFIWNYLEAATAIPHPSNAYWMPLSSVVTAASFQLFGLSFRAAQVPMIIASSILPVIGYWLGKDIFPSDRYAWSIAGFLIFSGIYEVYWIVPESFALFAVFGSLALILSYKALRDSPHYLVPAGGMVALAQLTRADGAMLLGSLAAAFFTLVLRKWHTERSRILPVLLSALGALLAYAIVLSPWLLRNELVFGQLFPTVGLKAAFVREYNDMFAYGREIDLQYYLDWGLIPILTSKLRALGENLWVWIQIAQFFLAPLVLIGLWRLRARPEYLPFHVYNILLYFVLSLVFTFQSPRGTYAHSGAALLPFILGAAIVGLDTTVDFAARHRPHWIVPIAQRNFTMMLVAFSVILSAAAAILAIQKWDDQLNRYQEIATWLSTRTDEREPVMLIDPPRYHYITGRPAIAASNDPPEVVGPLARRFGVRYIVLERAHTRPMDRVFETKGDTPDLKLEAVLGDARIYSVLQPEVRQ